MRCQSPIGAESTRQMTETQQDLMLCRTIIEGILPEGNGRLVYNNQLSSREHIRDLILALMLCCRFEVGNSRVYFKAGVLEELEGHRAVVLTKNAVKIQRYLRGFVPRLNFLRLKASAVIIQKTTRMSTARAHFIGARIQVILVQVHQCMPLPVGLLIVFLHF